VQELQIMYGIYTYIVLVSCSFISSSSSRMHVINHNWSATKQHLHPQCVAEISRHLVLSGDRIQQCGTSSGSCHKDTVVPQGRSVPVPYENGSAGSFI